MTPDQIKESIPLLKRLGEHRNTRRMLIDQSPQALRRVVIQGVGSDAVYMFDAGDIILLLDKAITRLS